MALSKTIHGSWLCLEEPALTMAAGAGEQVQNTGAFPWDANPSGAGVLVELETTETSATNGSIEARLQVRGVADKETAGWRTVATTTGMALDTRTLTSASEEVDLRAVFAPEWRVQIFTDGATLTDTADVKVRIYVPYLGMRWLGLSRTSA